MANVRSTLERIRDRFVPPPGGFERLVARRERRLRIRRISAATVALALSVGLFVGLWSVMRTTVPPPPRLAEALTVRIGGSPVDVAVDEGTVWVATLTDPSGRGEVVRIDPTEGRVVARIPLPEVGALAVGEGGVWVVNLGHGTVTRIDPETDEMADVITMPPLPYEVAAGDGSFVPEDITVGFGRVWVSTARGSVASIDPGPGEASVVTGEPRTILGGVTTGAGSVWAWNIFEPPEAEVWRISPRSGEVERIPFPATVLDAAAGSVGLYVLHAETGEVSLVGAVDPLLGPSDPVPVGSAGERANAIVVNDPTVYVAAAAGNIYAIDQGSGDATLLTRLSGEPTALEATADGLWVAAADGTVTKVALEREVAPDPTVIPTPPGEIQAIGVGPEPNQIAIGEGGVWVTTLDAVVRIDPETGDVVAKMDLAEADGAIPGGGDGIAVGFGSVWVANPVSTDDDPRFPEGTTGGVARIDPATNKPVDAVVFTDRTPTRVVAGEGAVWVTTGDAVTRLDPETLEVEATIPVGRGPGDLFHVATDIAVGEGSVWVAVGVEPPHPGNAVARIDPQTNRVVVYVELFGGPSSVTVGEGAVWAAVGKPGFLVRIDPGENTEAARVDVAELADAVSTGAGSVWVGYFESGTGGVAVIDPTTEERVRRIALGPSPSDVAVSGAAVWVVGYSDDVVLRVPI